MPKLTRIYTRTGDDGTTGLIGGRRIKKDAPRIEAYGTIDELSSTIGAVRAALRDRRATEAGEAAGARSDELDRWLAWVQDMLFNLGSELATVDAEAMPPRFDGSAATLALERAIDRAQADLPPLANFIHPGGSSAGALLHVARTVCRRAERLLVTLGEHEPIPSGAEPFVNRLSDALFVWSRWINQALHRSEYIWNPSTEPPLDGVEELP